MQLLMLAVLLLVSLTATAESLRFARNENLPEQDVAEAIFLQAMRNLQVSVEVDAVPPARANMLNLTGAVAGEVVGGSRSGCASRPSMRNLTGSC